MGFECVAYIQAEKEKAPKWLDFLESVFDLSAYELTNTSNSFILLVKSNGRIFAFTFGYGYSAIDKALIEPGFGLRVTLNSIKDGEFDTVDTRNIDLRTRQTRTHISLTSPIYEFGINTTMDWIRFASGKPNMDSEISRYSGSDSLQISIDDASIEQLGETCSDLLEAWTSTDYKEKFPFVDNLKRIPKETPLAGKLTNEMKKLVKEREKDRIALAHPEIPNPEIESYKCFIGRHNREFQELSLVEFYEFLDELDKDAETSDIPLENIMMLGIDSTGNAKTQKKSITEYIVCEIDIDEKRYIHSLSEWFEVAIDYMVSIKERVRALEQDTVHLPKIRKGESEGDYNARVAKENNYLLLDKKAFTFGNYRDRIECCDLATPEYDLIAVKKMSSSATLSHLFSQGSVSAKLLKLNKDYEDKLKSLYDEKWHNSISNDKRYTFVFAIPADKPGSITDALFFFSLVNLVDHVDTIHMAGFNVKVCKIEYSD
jgi:uncharacterized protein (TIGR04141 family)